MLKPLILFTLAACHIPPFSEIHLSTCMRICNADTRLCLAADAADPGLCSPLDAQCQAAAIREKESCVLDETDCVADCVEETERLLRGGEGGAAS